MSNGQFRLHIHNKNYDYKHSHQEKEKKENYSNKKCSICLFQTPFNASNNISTTIKFTLKIEPYLYQNPKTILNYFVKISNTRAPPLIIT